MSENCTHNCGTCGSDCPSRKPESMLAELNADSKIKHVIGVVSGKGGVGKSLVSSLLAVTARRRGRSAAIMDADITGPSIPRMFGLHQAAVADDKGIYPAESASGIKVMSLNLLVEDETAPVIWRGPVIGGTVRQFWTDVVWGDVDYMFIDMPPGTGDVPLTVFQSIPVDGIVVVASPQDLVSMIVEKAVNMAERMNIPIIGIIENYSYLKCPDCGSKIKVFGDSGIDDIAERHGLRVLAHIPIDPQLAQLCDRGQIELFEGDFMDEAADIIMADKS